MLLKKVSLISATVVASLALATGAGVWARQTGAIPNDDQPVVQRAEKRVGGENELSNTARSSGTLLVPSNEQKDEALDRLDLLRLDVELLEGEVEARKQAINFTSQALIQMRVSGHDRNTNELLPPDTRRANVESLEKELSGLRREWLVKKKELRQKQSELDEGSMNDLQERRRRAAELKAKERPAGTDQRAVNRKNAGGRIQPATPDAPGISPILEKRLSEIEGKLDSVLKALADLKRDPGQ